MTAPLLLTKSEAAEALRISARKLDRLIASRQLRAVKLGRHVRITPAELLRFINSLTGGAT